MSLAQIPVPVHPFTIILNLNELRRTIIVPRANFEYVYAPRVYISWSFSCFFIYIIRLGICMRLVRIVTRKIFNFDFSEAFH